MAQCTHLQSMERVRDEDVSRIDARIRERWPRLCWTFGLDAADETFEPVAILVSRSSVRATFREHVVEVRLKAGTAKLYRQMDYSLFVTHFDDCLHALARTLAKKLALYVGAEPLVLLPTIEFAHPLDSWLPLETVRYPSDLARIARILKIGE